MEQFIIVEKEDEGLRIDSYLSDNMDGLSRNAVQKLIESNNILVGSKEVKPNYKVKHRDKISVNVPEAVSPDILPEKIDLDVLYEDSEVIVINKPKGMVVHPAAGHYKGTLVNALMYHCAGSLSGINGVLRPGIVHRIDKDTSGVLMVAKTNAAHSSLALQLAEHSINRRYLALVLDNIKEDEGTINKPIGRHPAHRKKMAVTEKNSKNAVTHFKVLERFGRYTYIEARLETGRTHQIRVHMSSIGHPLVGDLIYGPKKQPFSLSSQALHARLLGFNHPKTGEYMEFEAVAPDYFEDILKKLRK